VTGPDFSRGYLRLPNALWEALFCRGPLTRRQLQIVAVVLRESWGWQQRDGQVRLWTRPLPTSRFAAATGLDRSNLARALARLVERGVLQRDGRRYRFVPDRWITPPAPGSFRPPSAPERPRRGVIPTPPTPGPKKAKTEERNVAAAGDNSSAAPFSDPFVAVVLAFVGSLAGEEQAALRRWVAKEGVAAVWQLLAPTWSRGPAVARAELRACLRERAASRAGD